MRSMRPLPAAYIAIVFLCFLGATVQGADSKKGGEPTIPDGLKGFSGVLRGRVVGVQDNGLGFRLEVTEVGTLAKKNKSNHPGSAVGKTLLVNVQWTRGKDGGWHPAERQVRFVKGLKRSEAIEIWVQNDEAERLHILELTSKQRERAGK
jgi:hypothetical protein